ncbi:ATP-binding protein [Pectinatus frisingensis]|uniref:ATP-binding protein n=1 Tax=Pectinatus frisingensis TaxID=865 RepID=UPI001E637EB0|nr:ATP-binding protein [Pectinatus frisingensis]
MGISHRFSTPFGFVWSLTFFGVNDGFSYSLLRTSLYAINLEFSRWPELFANETLVAALVDRLTYHSHVLNMNGDSYRLKSASGSKIR